MDKVTKFALEQAGFKNIENIAMVIAASSNPKVALEMVLGIWEMPEIKKTSTNNRLNGENDSVREFVEFKPLLGNSDVIKYRYKTRKEITIYFSNEVYESKDAAKKAYHSDPEAWENYEGSNRNYTYVKTGKVETYESSCSLERWNG